MVKPKPARHIGVVAVLLCATILNGCQMQNEVTYHHNVSYFERTLIDDINSNGPGDRYVINKVQVHEQVVDWFTISLTSGTPYAAHSESGSGRIGAGSVVQFCGRGEFLGIDIYTGYPYLCKRGNGLVFGVTKYGWVHLYGTGEFSGTRISIKKAN
ncbi:MAG: hypothetical protein GY875_02225 [Gammaproteobacteria bacterium]|nr:hypothetical protein [Gammaproteobacteria bacterium]